MIAGLGEVLKTDRTEHAVIFIHNLGDPFHQPIAAAAASRAVEFGKVKAMLAPYMKCREVDPDRGQG